MRYVATGYSPNSVAQRILDHYGAVYVEQLNSVPDNTGVLVSGMETDRPIPRNTQQLIAYMGLETADFEHDNTPAQFDHPLCQQVWIVCSEPQRQRLQQLYPQLHSVQVHNHWEHVTGGALRTWPQLVSKPQWDYLWLSRRATPERLWLYWQLCMAGFDHVGTQGTGEYWGDDWYSAQHWDENLFDDIPAAQLFYSKPRVLPEHLGGLSAWNAHNEILSPQLAGAYAATRISLVLESHVHQAEYQHLATEKLWRSVGVGQTVYALGTPNYTQHLNDLGYDFRIPPWDHCVDYYARVRTFADTVLDLPDEPDRAQYNKNHFWQRVNSPLAWKV